MLVQTEIAKRVPFEHVLQARQLRSRILLADEQVQCEITRLNDYAKRIVGRRFTFRQDHLSAITHEWQTRVPDLFRLGLAVERKKHSLTIADARIVASQFRLNEWQDGDSLEPSLSLYIFSFHCAEGIAKSKLQVLGTVSLHAVGRYYQRTFDHTDQTLCSDLSNIALQFDKLSKLKDWRCASDNGIWRGSTVSGNTTAGKQQRLLTVRTFLSDK